jgi:hypothetical protein
MTALAPARALFVALLVAVTWLSVSPNPDDSGSGFAILRALSSLVFGSDTHADKLGHFSAYAALAVSAGLARLRLKDSFAVVASALIAYGAALEGVQSFLSARDASVLDGLANAAGAALGASVFALARGAVRVCP